MKKQTVIRAVLAALFAASLWMGMSACDKPDGNRIETEADGSENSLPLDKENPDQNNQPDTPDHEEKKLIYSVEAQTSIEQLQALLTSNTRLAVAYLGERARNEAEPLTEWLWNNVPGMMEKMPFLAEIPEEHILGGTYGDLYCVLPRKDDTTLVVRQIEWLTYGNGGDRFEGEELYHSDRAAPVLVYVTHGEWGGEADAMLNGGDLGRSACWEPSVEIGAEGADGESLFWWSPKLELESVGLSYLPCDENEVPMLLDLTGYGDVGLFAGPDSALLSPTTEGVTGRWLTENGWMLHLAYDPVAENGNGGMVLYHPYELEDGTTGFEFDCHGTWALQDGNLQIEAYDPAGNPVGGTFRVRVSPSGDLYIYEAEDGTKLPFFEPEAHDKVLSPYEE